MRIRGKKIFLFGRDGKRREGVSGDARFEIYIYICEMEDLRERGDVG